MQTILVPIDFSDNSSNAVEYAVEIAKVTRGNITFLHVLTDRNKNGENLYDAEKNVASILETVSEGYPNAIASAEIIYGDVVPVIVDYAEQHKVDLIVMGTEGFKNLQKAFFGTNTAHVIEQAPCPVLSIPSNIRFKALNRILFATNFAEPEMKGALQLTKLAESFGATIILAHVTTEDGRVEMDKALTKMFSSKLTSRTNYRNIIFRTCSENTVSLGIDSLIRETRADLVAFSTRKRGVFEKMYNPSLTQKFSLHARIPLMAYHSIG
jgi:nucleotide-binding universal stress UspA family protein